MYLGVPFGGERSVLKMGKGHFFLRQLEHPHSGFSL